MKEITESQKQYIAKLDHWISVQVLLASMLQSWTMDNYDEIKKVYPSLANICKNDIYHINRMHENYMKKLRPVLSTVLLDDFEELKEMIEKFANMKKCVVEHKK